MKVLLSNDDGYGADGMMALYASLKTIPDWEIWIVAPDQERSATSMSLSIFEPLTLQKIQDKHYKLNGYPADCVNIALHLELFPAFDLVVSGINQGPNLGDDVHYSGTVAAARQAAIKNINAIAVSSPVIKHHKKNGMAAPAQYCKNWLQKYFSEMKTGIVYNMNFPEKKEEQALFNHQVIYTHQGRRTYHDHYKTTRIKEGVWKLDLQDTQFGFIQSDGSDFDAILNGDVSVTPLGTYTTDKKELERWLHKN